MHEHTSKHRIFVLSLFFLLTLQVDFALAETPVTAFDVGLVVECRDVTPASELAKKPKSKLVEAVFKVSTLCKAGNEEDLTTVAYTMSDDKKTKTLEIIDFIPKTELTTDVLDPIVVIEETETGISGQVSIRYQTVPSADAGGNVHKSVKSSVQYKKLPPKTLLVASGTDNRRHAVVFRLHPDKQTTLAGERVFSVIFSVPKNWKADWVYLKCEALSVGLFNRKVTCGLGGFAVGLYLEGDDDAQSLAEQLAEKQQSLFEDLAKPETDNSWLSIGSVWEWFLDKLSPRQKAVVLNEKLYVVAHESHVIEKKAPASVKERLADLDAAKANIERLSGTAK